MMDIDDRVNLVPGNARSPSGFTDEPGLLGRVIGVTGAQAAVQLATNRSSPGAPDNAVTVGSLLGIATEKSLAIGALCEISLDGGGRAIGRVDLLGEIIGAAAGEARFQPGMRTYPRLGDAVLTVDQTGLQIVFDTGNPDAIAVGRLQQNDTIAAHINAAELVQKHFAVVGSTGAGKSSAVALILRKIMGAFTDLRILLIDAHNEYGHCFGDRAQVLGPGNLKLPFWLFNFDEIVQIVFGSRTHTNREVSLLAELIPLAKTEYARSHTAARASYRPTQAEGGRFTVDTPVPYRLEDVIAAAESRMGKLENGDLAVQYQRLLMRINLARTNPRYAFIFDDAGTAGDVMVEFLCQLLRLNDQKRPMAVVQLAGFPAETMEVIVSVLFRLAFEFGVWSDALSPLLIVCEEAHNYANADRTAGFAPARDGLSRIAKEGRKHGVFLGLITQRPHQLDATLISQCSTVFAMRLGHKDDQAIVGSAVSEAASRLLSFLPSLGTREALAIGAAVPTVMRLRFEELPPDSIPKSQVVWGGALDVDRIGKELIAAVVARWRGIAASTKPAAESKASPPPGAGDFSKWSA